MDSDCYYTIISFLDIENIYNIALINKQFYIISRNELIWKSFYNDNFSNIECTKMFHNNYIKCYKLNKFLIEHKMDITKINKELYLCNEQLQSIPPEIGQLNMLQTLYLSNNQLQSIPPEIGQLNMLRILSLDNTQLKLVPENCNRNIIQII